MKGQSSLCFLEGRHWAPAEQKPRGSGACWGFFWVVCRVSQPCASSQWSGTTLHPALRTTWPVSQRRSGLCNWIPAISKVFCCLLFARQVGVLVNLAMEREERSRPRCGLAQLRAQVQNVVTPLFSHSRPVPPAESVGSFFTTDPNSGDFSRVLQGTSLLSKPPERKCKDVLTPRTIQPNLHNQSAYSSQNGRWPLMSGLTPTMPCHLHTCSGLMAGPALLLLSLSLIPVGSPEPPNDCAPRLGSSRCSPLLTRPYMTYRKIFLWQSLIFLSSLVFHFTHEGVQG